MNQYDEKVIRAYQTDSTIRVYQAFSDELASLAVKHHSFKDNPHFKMTRMTWIKPSFLWMMYRAGWGNKDNKQQKILAIDISKEGFDWALAHSCSSHKPITISTDEWNIVKSKTPVRVQWDPERNLLLEPLKYRTIQIGLSGIAVEHYINKWITGIIDITEEAKEISNLVVQHKFKEASLLLPNESIYIPDQTIEVAKL
ncbi:DUF4291 domain-containing protein [Acinetobacter bereziniae]|uniref:DUF4291 domain-containing protein n=3 Tax=Acinetobacter bereziniae TaxID=106648 RepID=UPI001250630F|nr:DUF4291 domain-containing protein [Acinetobacter bereziniae]MBJ8551825.1 DUF4291 domain-containing protein [Acinetobacter bereziniae]MCV2443956.1 DUF4291 domain-containing protein [Acinetobacter bereziniae]NUF65580.1 DUF4291 domain-containing protein [Acinetobacter bereziniae]NUG66108.1 DUF4291 domain-containing protein [Acinetobacter bereziniae]NUG71969.1 DUF4291 domain-containing protein [Acinetobacter bereziniae]